MFEAFGAVSPKGAKGPAMPQRSETQRAIDAQRGLDPRESRTPSAELLRAMRAQVEAEHVTARRAPRVEPEASSPSVDTEQPALGAHAPLEPSATGASDEDRAHAEESAIAASEARMFQPAAPAQRTLLREPEPSAHEDGSSGPFVLPFGWVTFLCLQLGLFAVAFGLGALTAGGGDVAGGGAVAAGETDLALDQAREEGADMARGDLAPERPARPAADPLGVRGNRPAPTPGNGSRPSGASEVADPHLAAFLDPTNLFSLQVASYDGSPNGQGLARHWQGYLREHQFPAVLRQVGTRLALFVGASPNMLAMEELQRRVLELRDDRGARIFSGPRVVNLDDYR
jgi:hypothetical protein